MIDKSRDENRYDLLHTMESPFFISCLFVQILPINFYFFLYKYWFKASGIVC